jgi:hypothetical protein
LLLEPFPAQTQTSDIDSFTTEEAQHIPKPQLNSPFLRSTPAIGTQCLELPKTFISFPFSRKPQAPCLIPNVDRHPWPPAPCKIQQQSISLINLALALDAAASVVLQKALTNFTCTTHGENVTVKLSTG